MITARPALRFVIHLFAGASSVDLERARGVILRAQQAGLEGRDRASVRLWRQRADGTWVYSAWHLRERDYFDELRECMDMACTAQFHEWRGAVQDGPCELESIRTEHYGVYGYRHNGHGEWEVSASVFTDAEGPQGLRLIRDIANDYAWMQAECDRLNARIHSVSVS